MNQDPMDQPENLEGTNIPREILEDLMGRYEHLNTSCAQMLSETAEAAVSEANPALIRMVSMHPPTLEYLVSRGIQVFLDGPMARNQKTIRDRIDGILDMADLLTEAADQARKNEGQ